MKRALDLGGATVGLVLLAPVLAAVAVGVALTSGRPVLFRQTRPGLHARPFTILKFRTMRLARPGEAWFETMEQRLTPFGRFLRTTSLDELPELWNVVRGDMSLVGPRPLLTEYLELYSPEEARRHEVRPGLTGWAAVHGRNTLPFRARLALDAWYVEHRSLRLDLEILLRTAWQVVHRSGARSTEDGPGLGFPIEHLRARHQAAHRERA